MTRREIQFTRFSILRKKLKDNNLSLIELNELIRYNEDLD